MPPDSPPRRKSYHCKNDLCKEYLGWVAPGGALVRIVNGDEVARIASGTVTCHVCHYSVPWDPIAYRVQRKREIEIMASLPQSPA